MTDHHDVRRAGHAQTAGCGHWLTIGARYLQLSSGKTLCSVCGLSWCNSTAERKALLCREIAAGLAPTGTNG